MRRLLLLAVLACCSSGAKRDDGPAVPSHPHDAVAVSSPSPTTMPKVYLSTPQGDTAVSVEIVSTEAAIERGLMYRQHLPPDDGMLFLMRENRIWSFWMRNTLIPLDIIFITKDMTIAGIAENAEPRTETLREVDKPSLYVLEVNGGFSAAHKITEGTKVQFEGVRR